ncbi:hypothetical protein B0A55_09305 [Friedmanniomyces simplex]|uniref:N-acetyltransferase domain-containing protein n=1 Tax=Friedmanniomyces simplex TaxID=329884 RepID=A0A4V5NEF0_9PEZI|nr:hypothetical protein B0A55_09305 [Friedmanniomyces simplex]
MSDKRKLAASNTGEPAAKYARKGRKDDDDTLVKRTNALSIETFRDLYVAEDIAQRVGVRKVMLTCFLSNAKARRFYERRGYTRDLCSPDDRKTRKRVVEVDYVIMSKAIENAPL